MFSLNILLTIFLLATFIDTDRPTETIQIVVPNTAYQPKVSLERDSAELPETVARPVSGNTHTQFTLDEVIESLGFVEQGGVIISEQTNYRFPSQVLHGRDGREDVYATGTVQTIEFGLQTAFDYYAIPWSTAGWVSTNRGAVPGYVGLVADGMFSNVQTFHHPLDDRRTYQFLVVRNDRIVMPEETGEERSFLHMGDELTLFLTEPMQLPE